MAGLSERYIISEYDTTFVAPQVASGDGALSIRISKSWGNIFHEWLNMPVGRLPTEVHEWLNRSPFEKAQKNRVNVSKTRVLCGYHGEVHLVIHQIGTPPMHCLEEYLLREGKIDPIK